MPVILFYSPFNQRSRDTESLMIAFRGKGHRVISLSQQEGYLINDFLRASDIEAVSYVLPGPRTGWWYYVRHILFFVRFCYKHKIDVVYSHLEPANFVASIGQYFIRAKTFLCRHHIDEGSLYRFDRDMYYRLTYKLAKEIIVVSAKAKQYMVEAEKIPARKIRHINLAYDFRLYPATDPASVSEIRSRFHSEILLISVCRLTEFKRPDLSIRTLKALIEKDLDAKLLILGKGEMQASLEDIVNELELQERVYMTGFVANVLDYMSASDFLIHPSLLDSSCVAVKEAGLVSRPVIVCKGVGDFDDYVVSGKNGFSVDPARFVDEAADVIARNYKDKAYLEAIGIALRAEVLRLFDVRQVIEEYETLNAYPGS